MSIVMLSAAVLVLLGLVGGLAWTLGHHRGRRAARHSSSTTAEDVLTLQAQQLHVPERAARLPAVAALEQHAQATPWHRAAVIEIFTGYLRRAPDNDAAVRRAVQRTLTAHLASAHGALYWGEADLDLDEAELEDLNLTGATIRRISARRAVLRGGTQLTELRVRETAIFAGATFQGALRCDDMIVERRTDLSQAVIQGTTSAIGCALRGGTVLSGATFRGSANFTDTIFFDGVALSDPHAGSAQFHAHVDLTRTSFTAARLDGVAFPSGVTTDGARFVRTPGTHNTAPELLRALHADSNAAEPL